MGGGGKREGERGEKKRKDIRASAEQGSSPGAEHPC